MESFVASKNHFFYIETRTNNITSFSYLVVLEYHFQKIKIANFEPST
jgi:hypothetical protein